MLHPVSVSQRGSLRLSSQSAGVVPDGGRGNLFAAALTSKMWCESAIDELWSRQVRDNYLLCVLGASVPPPDWSEPRARTSPKQWSFLTSPTSQAWESFRHYSNRVVDLSITDEPPSRSVYNAICSWGLPNMTFPKMTTVRGVPFNSVTFPGMPYALPWLGPNIRELFVPWMRLGITDWAEAARQLFERSPFVEYLIFDQRALHTSAAYPLEFVRLWPLVKIAWYCADARSSVLEGASRIPTLEYMRISTNDDRKIDAPLCLTTGAFAHLNDLCYLGPLSDLEGLLCGPAILHQMQKLYISGTEDKKLGLRELLSGVSKSCPLLETFDLEAFVREHVDCNTVKYADYASLLSLPHIKTFWLTHTHPIAISINDFRAICTMWPKLERLQMTQVAATNCVPSYSKLIGLEIFDVIPDQLNEIRLTLNGNIPNEEPPARWLPNLQKVVIGDYSPINIDRAIEYLRKRTLATFQVGYRSRMDDEGLVARAAWLEVAKRMNKLNAQSH